MNRVFQVLLFLNISYCIVGLMTKTVPAWRMFEHVEPLEIEFTDRAGVAINVYDYLPQDAHLNHVRQVVAIAKFICEKERGRGPFLLKEKFSATVTEVNPEDCQPKL